MKYTREIYKGSKKIDAGTLVNILSSAYSRYSYKDVNLVFIIEEDKETIIDDTEAIVINVEIEDRYE